MGWLDPLRNTVVGLDTAPLIYFIEKNPTYYGTLLPFFEVVHNGGIQVVTSTLTLTEVLVLPYRSGNQKLAFEYTKILLNSPNLTILPVSNSIATAAARVRAAYGYKSPDAIQIATAQEGNAKAFLTNDSSLKSIPAMQVLQLDQLRGKP